MITVFCNDCHLSDDIPKLVADELLGIQQLDMLKARYKQMRKCYDFSYAESVSYTHLDAYLYY